ncbi:PCNA-interacting partner isoform X3 [Monodelphis domestica]|uniref:PCNA-interacting partner isoform X3 n=1 Tax=Monodelphis domestica TaxID=13616 RepID=UPI0004432702|nr:PCNA-interacting partner isoform X3 [Monodelphis domestica]
MASFSENILDMIKSLRRNWHSLCPSERTTVCGADSMLLALQLSMAEINKQHSGEFTVSLSDVLVTWKHLLHEKLGLPFEVMEVVEHYEDIRNTYGAFLKSSNMLDLIDVYQKCQTLTSTCENKVMSPVQLLDFLSGRSCVSDEDMNLSGSSSPISKCHLNNKKVQLIARKIICSYLTLLVNSKNDLALAHIINIPDRGLGREAFTDLKHAARAKQMSVFQVISFNFQVATSFIRMIELGGKGYAPSPSDPLRTHGKGLNNLIIFMDKLEEILGEIQNPRIAGGRILSAIKTELIKGRSSGDPFRQATEEVAQDLDLRIKNIINSQQEDRVVNTTGSSPARPKSHAINHGTAYCGRDMVKTLLVLLDEEAANPPTGNKADLLYGDENTTSYAGIPILTLFSSPTQANEFVIKPLRERVQKSLEEKKVKMKQTLIRSQFACTYKDDFMSSHDRCNDRNHSPEEPVCILRLQNDITEGMNSSVGVPTLGTSSENVHLNRNKNEKISKKSSGQTGNKSPKRKQVDLNSDNNFCDHENELSRPQMGKIPKVSSKLQNKLNQIPARSATKCCKPGTKNKLIAGQAKLTQFFRL